MGGSGLPELPIISCRTASCAGVNAAAGAEEVGGAGSSPLADIVTGKGKKQGGEEWGRCEKKQGPGGVSWSSTVEAQGCCRHVMVTRRGDGVANSFAEGN